MIIIILHNYIIVIIILHNPNIYMTAKEILYLRILIVQTENYYILI